MLLAQSSTTAPTYVVHIQDSLTSGWQVAAVIASFVVAAATVTTVIFAARSASAARVGAEAAGQGAEAARQGADASERAAKASEEAGRNAFEALALAIKPALTFDYGEYDGVFRFLILNPSAFDATDVCVEVDRFDGLAVPPSRTELLPRMTQGRLPWLGGTSGHWYVQSGPMPPNPSASDIASTFRSVVLSWSDFRGIARYECRVHWEPRQPNQPAPGNVSHVAARVEQRIR